MMDFITWFLQQLPAFLLSEPVSAFTAFGVLFCLTALLRQLIHFR